ncbi:MAG: transglutaminase family protein [Xanthomonadales bacterium]|nr:transglutaminase family protein [Xanthomonadales bacterium]
MRLLIEHHTSYRYRQPVEFDPHRLMLLPHEDHALSIVDFDLQCSPQAELSWLQDVFGNSVAIAHFAEPSDNLNIVSRLIIERPPADFDPIPLVPTARRLPVAYPPMEQPDLAPAQLPRHPEDQGKIQAWLQEFVATADGATQATLDLINKAIRSRFDYRVRLKPGIQTPAETLRKESGTCRDFALLMMEAARSLGLAARFVSGYLHDPRHDPDLHGAGHTHAWAQIYLPGPGWIEYDPTNGIVSGDNLIRAAVARDPAQAIPVDGTFRGPKDATVAMDVSVTVEAVDDQAAL